MSLILTVDGERWRAHLREVAEAYPGLVPVVKGNGYGFTAGRLARRAQWLAEQGYGTDTLAVGTYDELPHVAQRFDGDLLVLTPWRPSAPRSRSTRRSRPAHPHRRPARGRRGPARPPARRPLRARAAHQHAAPRPVRPRALGRRPDPRPAPAGPARGRRRCTCRSRRAPTSARSPGWSTTWSPPGSATTTIWVSHLTRRRARRAARDVPRLHLPAADRHRALARRPRARCG